MVSTVLWTFQESSRFCDADSGGHKEHQNYGPNHAAGAEGACAVGRGKDAYFIAATRFSSSSKCETTMMFGGTVAGSALAALIIRKRRPSADTSYELLDFRLPCSNAIQAAWSGRRGDTFRIRLRW